MQYNENKTYHIKDRYRYSPLFTVVLGHLLHLCRSYLNGTADYCKAHVVQKCCAWVLLNKVLVGCPGVTQWPLGLVRSTNVISIGNGTVDYTHVFQLR